MAKSCGSCSHTCITVVVAGAAAINQKCALWNAEQHTGIGTLALAHWHWHTGIGTLALDIWTQRKCFTALKFEHSGQIWKSSVIAYEYCTVSCVERSMFFSESDITCNQFSPCYVLAVMQMDTSSTWNFQAPTLFTSNTYSQIARQ